ncbi:c-type cytochrome biogenesis protein CcsB [Nakamurella sp.]|uniref:c-type cytochrome biogenesis protein CcsB n=1 Tax=Nakamurella sp. TaxID=1869182 RepID=UPI0037838EF7
MNQTWAEISDLAFEAALAAYVVALVCYAIELASRRAVNPAEAVAAGHDVAAGTTTLVRTGPIDPGAIGRVDRAPLAPWGVRFGRAAVVVTVVGAAANVLSIVARGLAVGRLPLANMYEFVSVICAAATITWLIVLARTGARTLGVFVMTPVVVLAVVAGTKLYVPAGPVVPALNSYWKWIHVTTVAISSSILLVSGAASALYLLRGRIEQTRSGSADSVDQRSPAAPAGVRSRSVLSVLPSMVTLDRIAYRTAIVGFPLFTFAVIAGAMWAEVAWGRYWGWDPKETCSFITWVFFAAYLHARSTAGWRGRRAAWICVLGWVSMIFNLFFINMVVSGLHSYAGLN